MLKHLLALATIFACALASADFSGNYRSRGGDSAYTLNLKQSGTALTGTAEGDGLIFRISGKVSGNSASGTAATDSGYRLSFRAKLSDALRIIIAAPDQDGQTDWAQALQLDFNRVTPSPKGATTGSSQLVGSWKSYTVSSSNGSGSESTSVATLARDGTFTLKTTREVLITSFNGSYVSQKTTSLAGTWTSTASSLDLTFEDGSKLTADYELRRTDTGLVMVVKMASGAATKWSFVG